MTLSPIKDLFDVKYGINLELVNLRECSSTTPNAVNFVSRTEKNNGVSAYVLREPDITANPAMTISVAGGGSVLSTFLQKEEYYSGRDVYILVPKKEYTELELLFYVYCIRQNKYRFNYGRQANKTLKELLIPSVIPKEWTVKNPSAYNNLVKKPLLDARPSFDVNGWKTFSLSDLFKVSGSKTTTLTELESYGRGSSPYVTTQSENNGVDGLYNFFTEDGGVLTVDSAVLGFCSYQPYNFSASDHVEKLTPKFKLNKYVALFLTTVLNLEQYRYNYGRKASQDRLKQSNVKLPVASDGSPDWGYMENFIKALPYSANI